MAIRTLSKYDISIGDGQPLCVMAGLNVLESEELALTVGTHLKKVCDKLGLPYIIKASFDKANRSSITSYRGPGMDKGLEILAKVNTATWSIPEIELRKFVQIYSPS